jgi:hypothetical protein
VSRAAALAALRQRISPASRFILVFVLTCIVGIGLLAGAHLGLQRRGLLPAPPVTATWCFNTKFAFLRDAPLGDRTLVAVGSSATWRNLDMAVFEARLPGSRALNASPCFLHVDQTMFLASFLLERMPRLDTMLVVLHPRDYESCAPADTAFFDPWLAGEYVDGAAPKWLVYLLGFRPAWLLREAIRLHRTGGRGAISALDDPLGSSILQRKASYWPPFVLDSRCDPWLARLETMAAHRGVRLVVATVPTMPAWAAEFDPGGDAVDRWTRDVAGALRQPGTVFLDGRGLRWPDEHFADPAHLMYPHHRAFSHWIADALAARRAAADGR